MLAFLFAVTLGLSPLFASQDSTSLARGASAESGHALGSPEAAPVDDDTILWSWKNGLRFQTEDGRWKGKFGGRIQWDASWLDIDDSLGLDDADGTEFRRARIFVDLENGPFFGKAEYDFAGQDVDFNDLWIGRRDVLGSADLKVGHMKEPLSLDQLTSANYITFLERSLMESLTLGRNTGVELSGNAAGDAVAWALGVFKNADDAGTNQMDGDYAVTGRVVAAPLYQDQGERLLHVGAAYSLRDAASLRFRQRPEIHLAPYVLDTGALASEDVSYANVELAGVFGSAHFQAEYTSVSTSGAAGAQDFDAAGYYGQVGYFLTGETRPYKRASGVFDRVIPGASYGPDGSGAVELAVRWSSVDLTDGGIVGGEQDEASVGCNWYLAPNLRVSLNYVLGFVDLGAGLGDEELSALLMRVQLDW